MFFTGLVKGIARKIRGEILYIYFSKSSLVGRSGKDTKEERQMAVVASNPYLVDLQKLRERESVCV